MALAAGVRLGPYEVVTALGAGGMGEVCRARDTRLDRTVAIKVLPPHVASDPEVRQRFEREARAVAALSRLGADVPELAEIEINPLVASPGGVVAVDARARLDRDERA